jgi:hypothetical protein
MPRKRVPKTPKKAKKFCNTCSKNETCKVLCPAVEQHLKIDKVCQRELPVSFKGEKGRNPLADLIDLGRSHPVMDKYGNLRATNPFTLGELQAFIDAEVEFPFLRKIENKILSLKYGQAKTYAEHLSNCELVIVTNGYCYKAYRRGKSKEFATAASAYLNLLRPRERYPLDPENVDGCLEMLRLLLPSM